MIIKLLKKPYATLAFSWLILAILFAPILYSDYAYLDDAHFLWHNGDHSNYTIFFSQGRWLTGILLNKIFSSISTIASIKILRLFAFFSWLLFLAEFFRLGKKWQLLIGFENKLLFVSGIYIACSLSVAIYIGWAACFEVGIATLLGLWAGHLFFAHLMQNRASKITSRTALLLPAVIGICSLYLYQPAFGAFFIPFAFYLINKKSLADYKLLFNGTVYYFIIIVVYYGLFLLSLKIGAVAASDRTTISTDVLGMLSFFFGMPLSQAFSFNFLFNTHSIMSQALPIAMMLLWVAAFLKTNKTKPVNKLLFISSFIATCMCIYLPVLVGRENFASYRTMFAFNFVVTLLLIDTILSLHTSKKIKIIFSLILVCCFTGVAYRNFRYNFIGPLQQEYQLVNNAFNKNYHAGIDTIYFLRPAENAFYKPYGIVSYKDEFGVPSTFKDWTPEPLIKQLILEKTKDRQQAERIIFIQFIDRTLFEEVKNKKLNAAYLDPELLFLEDSKK
ncbi:MAG: hypothetical protein H7334_10855 [Ferruginibacter sp.]|nr:hypothetical protein [Ferruginibacter sp.]